MIRKTRFEFGMAALLILALLIPSYSFARARNSSGTPKVTAKAGDLRVDFRDLWVGHVFWVRNVVLMTKLGDTDAAKVAEDNAIRNAKSIANSVTPFYGKDASEELFGLLAAHYRGIKDYMSATFAANKEAKDAAAEELKKNSDEIATLLGSANPNWPKNALQTALLSHVGHHIAEIEAIGARDYVADAQTWDAMRKQVYIIADLLADGIVKQFPMKYRK